MDIEESSKKCGDFHSESSHEDVVCFDIDDTLILWGNNRKKDILIQCPYTNTTEWGEIHQEHVKHLIEHKKAGHFVIVWSQGGACHVKEVIDKLNIAQYVDLMISKPMQYYDDIDCQKFMGTRTWVGNSSVNEVFLKGYEDRW